MTPFYQRPCYFNWLREQATLANTDGCSRVTGFKVECCYEHDLAYFYHRDPRDAYLRWKTGSLHPWREARPIDRGATDARFRRCLQARSRLGFWSPMALWRWVGVKVGGSGAWKAWKGRQVVEAPLPPAEAGT